MGASDVSRHRAVRIWLSGLQRQVAREYDVVMDGRDIGTNVLRDTPHKFYLTATVTERARRRLLEMRQRGTAGDMTLAQMEREIKIYETQNKTGNKVLDTTEMTVEAVTDEILRCVCGEDG